ncbi:hypothetical protein [Deinococcus multiflagellatus]|uniref:Phage protein n=1 Tax=Deinococcus multiflagellatus TaxID=1656887 RepID=A0ABW1ZI81_9DEIO|nr:hypothetical protein [Deinococcus multiflagellatus]MBZ9713755.1 hypothetical protein [Deinococcus multiflagellatus]
MAAPEPLPEEVQDELEVLVGPDAWTYHEALTTGRVDVARAYRVRRDVQLVAADVLTAAAAAAQGVAAGQAEGKVKRFRIEGKYEEEYFPSTSVDGAAAARWLALAETYRLAVAARPTSLQAFMPSVDPWGVEP